MSVDARGFIRAANAAALASTGHATLEGAPLSLLLPRLEGPALAAFARTLHARPGLAARLVRLPVLQADGVLATMDLAIRVHRSTVEVARASRRRPGLPERAHALV